MIVHILPIIAIESQLIVSCLKNKPHIVLFGQVVHTLLIAEGQPSPSAILDFSLKVKN